MQRGVGPDMLPRVFICPECRTVFDERGDGKCDRDDSELAEVLAHQTKARYPLLGQVVGDRYHLIGGLGQGGLGTVYLAQHRHLGQLFAVKFLELEILSAQVRGDSVDEYRKDFLKEARVASLIRHESVVRVSDFGEFESMPYLVMDFVPGPSLLHVLGRKGRFAVAEALNISRQIAEALEAFHERRLVHRDLKPANVILDPRGDGRLTLVDLGLVKDISGPGGKASTHPLALRGTPGYLAPEQVPAWVLSGAGVDSDREKQPVDARVDIYALGVILYEMVAGVSPYPDGSNTSIIVYACTRPPIPISRVEPPVKMIDGLEDLIYRTMAQDPAARPQSASEFLEQLEEIALAPAMASSWPSIALGRPKKKKPQLEIMTSSDALLLPLEPSRDSIDLSLPLVDDDGDYEGESEAATAVFDADSESKLGAGAGMHRPSHDEDHTMEADPDSFDRALDKADLDDSYAGFGPDAVTRIEAAPETSGGRPIDMASAASGPVVGVVERQSEPGRKTLVGGWVWAVVFAAAAGVGIALWLAADDTPLPGDGPVVTTVPPPRKVVVPAMVPDARVVIAAAVPDAAVAKPAPEPDAAPKPDAAPTQAAPRKPTPRRPVARPKPKPKPKPAGNSATALFAKAETAQRAGRLEEALRLYEQYKAVADQRHPQFSTVGSRIGYLKRKLAAQ